MKNEVTPKRDALEEAMQKLLRQGVFVDREAIARAVFERWEAEHMNPSSGWSHGTGKVSNRRPPSPEKQNCLSGWHAYMSGHRFQNLQGWRMAAEVLKVDLMRVVEMETPANIKDSIAPFPATPGEVRLKRLANVEVSEPQPKRGSNAVSDDASRKQAISLTVRPSFGTLRGEEICDPDGKIFAIANIELSHADLLVCTQDIATDIFDGIGVNDGEQTIGSLICRYMGPEGSFVRFEVSSAGQRGTLAGTSQVLIDMVMLEGKFSSNDWIGVAIDTGGMEIVKIEYANQNEKDVENPLSLKAQIKRQIVKRGIEIEDQDGSSAGPRIAARRYFMFQVFNESSE